MSAADPAAGVSRPPRRAVGAPPPRRSSGLGFVLTRAAIYLATLVPIVLVYSTKARGLLIAPPIALVGAIATWFFLNDPAIRPDRRLICAGAVALVMAEITWALGYWDVVPLVGDVALWLAFYVLSGVLEHAALRRLDRHLILEYGGVALLGILVVLAAGPWRS